MTIQALPDAFSVCKVADYTLVDRKAVFCFSGQTDAERSLVCRTQDVPDNVTAREDGWRAMRITGTLDFSLIGVLAGISAVLAENGIGIFVLSTYDTDYILAKQETYARALQLLAQAGYRIIE